MGIIEDIFMQAFHEGIPRLPSWVVWIHRPLGNVHCQTCLRLDGCFFRKEGATHEPQHPHCHCKTQDIPYETVVDKARAECDIRKFSEFIFNPDVEKNRGKKNMFNSWGYTIEDAEYLTKEFENQGRDKYIQGQYQLGKLNKYGQRISITIELLNRKTNKTVSFTSGWMIYPEGEIRLMTPYGGK